LVIIAEGMLEYVPFCALVTKDGSFLVQRCSIRYWPSVTAFLLIQTAEQARRVGKKTALNALVLADPLFKPSYSIHFKSGIVKKIHPTRLPGTRLEAKSIQRILKIRPRVGALATSESLFANTKSVLDEKSPGIKIVHIASHGFVDTNNPENSFLLFSDTAITAKQLYNYDPGLKVELVVLSACQTALGKSHPDSMIGLSNAFLIAGANSVVSTLWRVHDRTVPRIMRKFYQSIAKGDNIDISLRNAQLTALRCVDTRNPVYWAAFKLIGSSANPLNVRRHQTQA
jgi:CHAT domain-containing protein